MADESTYVYQPYPGCRYHATLAPVVVQNEDEDKALGEGWFKTPAEAAGEVPVAVDAVDPEPEPEPEDPEPAPTPHRSRKK